MIKMIIPVHSNTFIMIAALIRPPLLFEAAPEGGGGTFEAAPRGGWDGQRGPPFFSSGGEAAPLPVPPSVQFKFLVGINLTPPHPLPL